MKGKITFWRKDKGYGFVLSGDVSYFLHISNIKNQEVPNPGDEIKFDEADGERGVYAKNAVIL